MSSRRLTDCRPGATSHCPRPIAARSTSAPARLTAQRSPGRASAAGASCTFRPRTRAPIPFGPAGLIASRSPALRIPDCTRPVTTRPAPPTMKLRSMAMRKPPHAGFSTARRFPIASVRRSNPAPVVEDTATTGASASWVGLSRARVSAITSSSQSASTRSILVIATMPVRTATRSRIARCSRVWGIGPSSAATTSRAASIAVTPASMLRMNFSWPGTSTKPVVSPGRSVSV